jgi:hypothetical protein
MIRYETANGPMLEEPECAQPAGHNGACRSAPALRRKREADLARLAAATRPCECGCGETAVWGHRYRRGHNPRSTWGNWVPRTEAA